MLHHLSPLAFHLRHLKSIIATTLRFDWLYAQQSFSQEGEDIVLRKLFDGKQTGFYIDIGAHHPYRYSNTQHFYKKGWYGINIDATPGSMNAFVQTRNKDTNLQLLIGNNNKPQLFYIFKDHALNTFSKKRMQEIVSQGQAELLKAVELQPKRLDVVLKKYLPKHQIIDFMSIDVEGAELEVLQSNNWNLYKPKVLVIEILEADTIEVILTDSVTTFLKTKGYNLFARTFNSCYFTCGSNH